MDPQEFEYPYYSYHKAFVVNGDLLIDSSDCSVVIACCTLTTEFSLFDMITGEKIESITSDYVNELHYMFDDWEERQLIVSEGLSHCVCLSQSVVPHVVWRLWNNNVDGARTIENERYAREKAEVGLIG